MSKDSFSDFKFLNKLKSNSNVTQYVDIKPCPGTERFQDECIYFGTKGWSCTGGYYCKTPTRSKQCTAGFTCLPNSYEPIYCPAKY